MRAIPPLAALVSILIHAMAAMSIAADDWPQWRGPKRTGVSMETGWLAGWRPNSEPRVAWRYQVGKGHSAVSVSNGRAYTMGWDGEKDTVYSLEASTGKLIWKQSYPSKTIYQWPGPNGYSELRHAKVFTGEPETFTPPVLASGRIYCRSYAGEVV